MLAAQPCRSLVHALGVRKSWQINPVWPGHASYPWSNTGATAYSSAPIWLGEFGTANTSSDINSTGPGSQGQWFTDLVNFVNSSYTLTTANNPGLDRKSVV